MSRVGTTRGILALVLLTLSFLMVACEEKTINQVLADPNRYANREVGLKGRVVESYSILGRGAYQIEDGTGRLWVVSTKGVPRKGARVGVRGKIRDGFDLGSIVKLPQAISHGLVMIETEHRAKDVPR